MSTIHQNITHESGIPLGGLGTGSIEIRPDGYFHEWQIFNLGTDRGDWAWQPESCRMEAPEMPPGALSFFLWVKPEGGPVLVRRLGLRSDQHNLYSRAWAKSVSSITFDGRFPVAALAYHDDDLPVDVSATVFSPFAPHDARTSGTPGFHLVFQVRNRTERPVETCLLATLTNPVARGSKSRGLVNTVSRDGRTAFLLSRTGGAAEQLPTVGSLALSVTGGEPSWVLGDYGGYFIGQHWHSDSYGVPHECLLDDFRDAGRLPSLPGGRSPAGMLRLTDRQIAALSKREKQALAKKARRYACFDSVWRRVESVDPALLETSRGLADFLRDVRKHLDHFEGDVRDREAWGDMALASTRSLAASEQADTRFALGWHFPNHYSSLGGKLGHMYERWFTDAEDVCRFLTANYDTQRRTTCGFADALYDTTLPSEMADAWSGQLSTLVKCSWWTRAGDFGIWEGLGCCGFHTTDITYQGSFNILALFPELQKGQMEMGARFQREDGRVHHFFTPDFSRVDDGFDRVDMNQQFVLLVCRDYLWTGDRQHLRRLWPNICRAMDNTAQLDRDGDGLPDHDTRRNTYDVWDFNGTPSYIADLWLAALQAAARLADDLGETKRAAAWRKTLRKGAAAFEKKLWNGAYYSLWVDGAERDECCMTDQLSGEWFAHLIGLGPALPVARIRAVLRAVMEHNYSDEGGLQNANYPPGSVLRLATHRNLQQVAPWTGIEYAIGSMMIDFGMVAEGTRVVKNVHQRYLRAGRFWNHVECGSHYYRAMSSWAVLLAATGFKLDIPRDRLEIRPPTRASRTRAPWVSPTGYGRFDQTDEVFILECESGTIAFRELWLRPGLRKPVVRVNSRKVAADSRQEDGATVIRFQRKRTLRRHDRLVVEDGPGKMEGKS